MDKITDLKNVAEIHEEIHQELLKLSYQFRALANMIEATNNTMAEVVQGLTNEKKSEAQEHPICEDCERPLALDENGLCEDCARALKN